MSKSCGDCEYYNREKEKPQEGFFDHSYEGFCMCDKENNYRHKDDNVAETCQNFKEAGHVAVGLCYITTMVVEILKMSDDCEELNILRNFRNTYIAQNEYRRRILLDYDIVGPIISECIRKSQYSKTISMMLYDNYIRSCVDYIKAGDNYSAYTRYIDMMNNLSNLFMINVCIPEQAYSTYDYQNAGHGNMMTFQKNQTN